MSGYFNKPKRNFQDQILLYEITRSFPEPSLGNSLAKQKKGAELPLINKDKIHKDIKENNQGLNNRIHNGSLTSGSKNLHKLKQLSSHVSEYNVLSVKFAPFDSNQLITCGRENIKFWRLTKSHLTGSPVILNHYARNSVFTVFDFLNESEDRVNASAYQIIVGSVAGMIFEINCFTRELRTVYKVHDSAICSLLIRNGLCFTGSQDQYVRIWPTNFNEFLLEAKQESCVVGIDVNDNGLQLVVGTLAGSISVLDLASQTCRIMMRGLSHEISQLESKLRIQVLDTLKDEIESQDNSDNGNIDKNANAVSSIKLLSLGRDNSIRVWENDPLVQSYEFECRENDECLAISFICKEQFLGGFESGTLRVFDLNKLTVVCDKSLFKGSILSVACAPTTEIAVAGDEYGNYKVVDLKQKCKQVYAIDSKETLLEDSGRKFKSSASFSKNEKLLALLSSQNKQVSIHETASYQLVVSIDLGSNEAHTVFFSNLHQKDLFVLTCSQTVKIYSICEGFKITLVREIANTHKYYISSLIPIYSNKVFATAGGDGKVKIWGLYENNEFGCYQTDAHSSAIYTLAYDPQSNELYSGGSFEGIFVWNLKFDENRFNEDCAKVNKMIDIEHKMNLKNLQKQIEKDNNAIKETKIMVKDNPLPQKSSHDIIEVVKCQSQNEEEPNYNSSIFDSPNDAESSQNEVSNQITENENDQNIFPDKTEVSQVKESEMRESRISQKRKTRKSYIPEKNPTYNSISTYIKASIESKQTPEMQESAIESLINDFPKYTVGCTHYKYYKEDLQSIEVPQQTDENPFAELKSLSGINIGSSSNLIWKKDGKKSAIYFVENKIVIEEFQTLRTQKIFHLNHPITCMVPDFKNDLIYIGTGATLDDLSAPIFTFNLSNFTFQTLDFHKKGLQSLSISPCGKFMLSVGHATDRKLVIFDLNSKEIIYEEIIFDFCYDSFFDFNAKKKTMICGVSCKNKVRAFCFQSEGTRKVTCFEKYFNYSKFYDLELNTVCVRMKNSKTAGHTFLMGTNRGSLISFEFVLNNENSEQSFTNLSEAKLGVAEISKIKFTDDNSKLVIGTVAGQLLFIETSKLGSLFQPDVKSVEDLSKETLMKNIEIKYLENIKFAGTLVNFDCSRDGKQGLCLLGNGDIHFFDLEAKKSTLFIGGVSPSDPVVSLTSISRLNTENDIFLSISESGKPSVWKTAHGVKLFDLDLSEPISCSLYDEDQQKLILFSHSCGIWHLNPFSNLKSIERHCMSNLESIGEANVQLASTYSCDSFIVKAIKLGFGLLPKYLLLRSNGRIEISDLALNKETFELQEIAFIETKPRIVDLDYHRSGFLALSNNKGKIYVYKNQNFYAGANELDFSFHCCFHTEVSNSCDYNWSIVRFDHSNGFTNHVCSISNNSKKISVFDFVNKQVKSLD